MATERFQRLVGELRSQWQGEEAARAEAMEGRLRGHFETVLGHAHEQLHMALQMHDVVDKRWMADVQARNAAQLELMREFERKCRALYDGRLAEYAEATDGQLRQFEASLLASGAEAARREAALRTQMRRMRVAAVKWRADYAADAERRYEATVGELEARYLREVRALLTVLAFP